MTPRRKILSVVETLHVGGDEMRLLNFVRALDKTAYDCVVLVMGKADPDRDETQGLLTQLLMQAGARVEHLGYGERTFEDSARKDLATLAGGLTRAPRLLWDLVLAIKREKPDVLDLRKHYAIMWGAVAGRLCGVNAIVGIDYYADALRPPLRRLAAAMTFRLLDALVSDAVGSVEGYRRGLPFLADRTHVIANGVTRPCPALDRQAMQRTFRLEVAEGAVVFGMVAKLAPFKGHMVLLDAARKVLDARPGRAAFAISGYARSEDYRAVVTRRCAELGLGRAVGIAAYPGPSDDIWAAIDIHVHPSLMDSAPIAIHESMALGLPAVVTAVGGVPDLVTDRKTGLVVPAGDAHALATAMIELIDNPDLAQRLGEQAKERYETAHTPEIMAARTCLLFEALLAAGPKALKPSKLSVTSPKRSGHVN
jgi:glycosyltransferase involved in cell wall biosynthesis